MDEIYYTRFETPLGGMWVAKSDRGLVKTSISETKEEFLRDIKRHYKPSFVESKKKFNDVDAFLHGYFSKKPIKYNGDLDLRGTEFQLSIWRAVHGIPYGNLSSYGALAASIGRTKAYRAAGNAVGANPCGLIIPCHRVIHADGGLGGFGGGLDLKRRLLAHEGILPNSLKGAEKMVELTDFFI